KYARTERPLFDMCVRRPCADKRNALGLPRGSGLELDHQFGGHPSAVLHVDALRLGPLADLGAVHPVRPRPAAAAGRPAGTAPRPPRRLHIARQHVPQRAGMPGVQVDLILGAVQSEADGALSLAAVKVVDEHGLDLLGHTATFPHRLHLPGWPKAHARTYAEVL